MFVSKKYSLKEKMISLIILIAFFISLLVYFSCIQNKQERAKAGIPIKALVYEHSYTAKGVPAISYKYSVNGKMYLSGSFYNKAHNVAIGDSIWIGYEFANPANSVPLVDSLN
jgi:hypothetical protein